MSYGGSRGRSYGGGRSRDYNRGFKPKPVEAGKEYEVDITEISRQGDGIARVQGFVVFVKNGKVGNKVKVKVNEVADRFAKAIIVG
jgi:predicted RNA-binding protein with TRAM domain